MTRRDWKSFDSLHSSDDEFTEGGFKSHLKGEGFFGLFLNGVLVGHMNLNLFGDDECHFQHIFIGEEYRGKGFSNALMEYSFNWYRERGIRRAHLYTEVGNETAQYLYKKYGFTLDSRAWHFIVPFSTLSPSNRYTCHEILEENIDPVDNRFQRLPAGEIRRWLNSDSRMGLMLKDTQGGIVGACLFTPDFPGCRPFEVSTLDCFDDFIAGIKERSLPEFDFVRLTFAGNDELAGLCKQRGYELVHEMFHFVQDL